jgi:SagB-type dehydrogenase family enzyme
MHVNPNLFFLIKDGQFIIWDYLHHRQFTIELAYLERLQQWSENQVHDITAIDQELMEAQLLIQHQPSQLWGWDELAQIYHIGTKNIGDDDKIPNKENWLNHYLIYCAKLATSAPELKTQKEGKKISLPPPDFTLLANETLISSLKKRKTSRSFNKQAAQLEKISTLLYVSLGPLHGHWSDLEENNLQVLGRRKSFPSAGGIHAEEAYLVALRVDQLQAGIYHYNSFDHNLTLIQEKMSEQDLIDLLYGQYFAEGLAFGLILTASFDKVWWKYPNSRAYRMVFLDIGHASQTLLLTATALGLSTWMTGAFSDTQIENLLNLVDTSEQPLFFLGFGYGDCNFLDHQTLLTIKQS